MNAVVLRKLNELCEQPCVCARAWVGVHGCAHVRARVCKSVCVLVLRSKYCVPEHILVCVKVCVCVEMCLFIVGCAHVCVSPEEGLRSNV